MLNDTASLEAARGGAIDSHNVDLSNVPLSGQAKVGSYSGSLKGLTSKLLLLAFVLTFVEVGHEAMRGVALENGLTRCYGNEYLEWRGENTTTLVFNNQSSSSNTTHAENGTHSSNSTQGHHNQTSDSHHNQTNGTHHRLLNDDMASEISDKVQDVVRCHVRNWLFPDGENGRSGHRILSTTEKHSMFFKQIMG